MPLPPSYKCPVCTKERQRGHIGDHVVSHSLEELTPYIINSTEVRETGAHPEVLCSGHKYVLCINNKQGYEKDKIKHKRHTCKNDYSEWIAKETKEAELTNLSMQAVINICKKNNIRGYSQKKKDEIIGLILKHRTESKEPHKNCECHTEITRLQLALLEKEKELELFKIWIELMPGKRYEPVKAKIEPTIAKASEPKKTVKLVEPLKEKRASPKIKASKKEQEKGMWCSKCEVCKCVAQYTRDLKNCGKCNKLCHFNDDLRNCYHWDCAECGLQICKDCNKAAGGNKLNSFCSKDCFKKHIG